MILLRFFTALLFFYIACYDYEVSTKFYILLTTTESQLILIFIGLMLSLRSWVSHDERRRIIDNLGTRCRNSTDISATRRLLRKNLHTLKLCNAVPPSLFLSHFVILQFVFLFWPLRRCPVIYHNLCVCN